MTPKSLTHIQAPIADEIGQFEGFFRQAMSSRAPLLDKIMGYLVRRKGKQIRPMLVFLSAGAAGQITERTYRGAALVELLHTATLVHDDVVDDASYRRGFFSINALWKNKIAVLVGDYLLSRGLLLSIDHGDFDLLQVVSGAVREMSEGELLQMEKARRLDIKEPIYLEIIRQKTASLIAACCRVGAQSGGATPEQEQVAERFGVEVGMAFQIKDDLFDYGQTEIGKPTGIDIREKKMTLPLIYALSQAGPADRKRILGLVRHESHRAGAVRQVIEFVRAQGGIGYATQVMNDYHARALALLETLPDTPYRQSLADLVSFTIEREK